MFAWEMINMKKKNKINNGIICISKTFLYSCPLSLDMDFKGVTLAMFYNDYIMKYRNMFKSRSLKKKISTIEDETQAGLIASDYGYVVIQCKNNNGNIYLPESYNSYQLCRILEELVFRKNFDFNLYKQFNDEREFFSGLDETEACDMVKSTYFDSFIDPSGNFIDYTSDEGAKKFRIIK